MHIGLVTSSSTLQTLNESRTAVREMLFNVLSTSRWYQMPMALVHNETYQQLEIMKHKPQSRTRWMHAQIQPQILLAITKEVLLGWCFANVRRAVFGVLEWRVICFLMHLQNEQMLSLHYYFQVSENSPTWIKFKQKI